MATFESVTIAHDTAMNTPSQFIYSIESITVSRTLIPQTDTESNVVFFVDNNESGKSFGSYATKSLAIDAANKAATLLPPKGDDELTTIKCDWR